MDHVTRRAAVAELQSLVDETKSATARFEPGDQLRYFDRLLTCAAQLFNAVGGVVWTVESTGLELAAKLNYQESRLENDDTRDHHRLFLASTAAQGRCRCLAPREAVEGLECANPTEFRLLVIPLTPRGALSGVLEFFFKDEIEPESLARTLAPAEQVRSLAEDFFLRSTIARQETLQRDARVVETFALAAHASLEVPRTAFTLASEIRVLTTCDRVTIGVFRRGWCRIVAVSGQEQFDRRAKAVRTLEALSSLCARTGETIVCDEAVGETAPELKEALYDYLEETHAKQLVVVPLKLRERVGDRDRFRVVGVVSAERLETTSPIEPWRARLEQLCPHAASALSNALEYEWPILASLGRVTRRSRLRKALGDVRVSSFVLATLTLVVGMLVFYPADFALRAPGKLQPILRREIFAELDGTVYRVYVKHGDDVRKGALLAELVNHDLNVAEAELIKQIQETSQEIVNSERELNDAQRVNALERGKITARRATATERLNGLRAQEAFYAEKRKRLSVVSPIDGRVATWNVADLLLHRPVRQGQALMTIVDVSADWELEIRLPESRLGHVLTAQQELSPELPVAFMVAADPYKTYRARVRDVRLAADVVDVEEGNVVFIKASLEGRNVSAPALGGDVRAKIYCGSRPLGYVWFHDIYEFFQSQVLFRL